MSPPHKKSKVPNLSARRDQHSVHGKRLSARAGRGRTQRCNVEVECKSLQLLGDGQLETCDLSFLFLSALSGAALSKIMSGPQPETRGCGSVRVPLECLKCVYFSSDKPVANPVANYTYGGFGVFLNWK